MSITLDKSWHLAETTLEIQVTEFELLLWRVFYSFLRWQEDCESYVNHIDLTGQELAVLHVIRMKDRPKTLYEISRLLNRDDLINVRFCIKKLLKLDLIKGEKLPNERSIAYEVTEKGLEDTKNYSAARKTLLIEMFKKETGLTLEETAQTLSKVKSIYDESGRIAASAYSSEIDQ